MLERREGGVKWEKESVFLPERLESEKASSNHRGKVAAARDHCARTGLLSMLPVCMACGFKKNATFHSGVPTLVSDRDRNGETSATDSCLRNFTQRRRRGSGSPATESGCLVKIYM